MNLDSLNGRWLEADYSLVSLSRMVMKCCNANNFTQMVDNITRVQYNSVSRRTVVSCIDHIYCNSQHRISAVRVITCSTTDHDTIAYTRFSKDLRSSTRTIRKRSYKDFKEAEYLKDISKLDFTDVYQCT